MGKQDDRCSPAFAKLRRGKQSAAIVPVALTIAGSDSSAGAGIQADLKTFSALGVYGLTAVTCVVAEIPGKVSRIEPVSAGIVREQIEVLAKNFQIGAIKTGLLCSAEIKDRRSMNRAGKELEREYGTAILLKGGHLAGDAAADLLFIDGKVVEFSAPFVRGVATHGTGCTYSAAITAGLASGLALEEAITQAKKFVTESIAQHFRWTSPSGKNLDALRHL